MERSLARDAERTKDGRRSLARLTLAAVTAAMALNGDLSASTVDDNIESSVVTHKSGVELKNGEDRYLNCRAASWT